MIAAAAGRVTAVGTDTENLSVAVPTVRAIESLAFTIPVYILLFATVCYVLSHGNSASFGTVLSRTDSMYSSTTVLTTVGFGDITAKTATAEIIVTCQMLLDLILLWLVVRLIVDVIKRGHQRESRGT